MKFGRIKNIKEELYNFFSGLKGSARIIVLGFALSYFLVGFDLSKELAEGEFIFFACILTESDNGDSLSFFEFFIFDPPLIGEFNQLQYIPPSSDLEEPYQSRAPPTGLMI